MFHRKMLSIIAVLLVLVIALVGCGAAQSRPSDENQGNTPGEANSPKTTTVEVYFVSGDEQFKAVTREVAADDPLEGALQELVKGPSIEEQQRGLTSWFSDETAGMVNGVSIDENGIAVVDFENFSSIIPNASTSAGSQELLGQLNRTVFQFNNVKAIDYRFNGDADLFWNWLQFEAHLVERAE